MSYKYEASIKEAINIEYHTDFSGYMNRIKEIDRVYAQAAKADEYEANKWRTHVNDCKAEAFDAILKAYDEAFSREHMAYEVSHIIEVYESGESHVKKLRGGLLHQMHGETYCERTYVRGML